MGNTRCGNVVVIAIANAHTPDDTTDSLNLRCLLWYKLRVAVDVNAVLHYNTELNAPGGSLLLVLLIETCFH